MRRALFASTLLIVVSAVALAGGGQEADVSTGVDAEIREDVESALARDGRVEEAGIQVTVEGGIVSLVGTVDSIRERNAAVADARNVLGVISVVDSLDVEPDVVASGDRLLALDVRSALALDPSVDESDIIVEASGSRITLYGSVDTLFERELASDIAADVTGVVTVMNQLTVEPTTDRGDRAIRTDVQNALVRNSLVDKENIVVLVNDGQVTLTGTVSSWVEEQEALDAAQFTAGVTSVVDQLEIAGPDFDGATGRTIRTQVREQLEWDIRVDASNISISVDDAIVTLSGTVESAASESAALTNAWSVAGVRDVVDRIAVAEIDRPARTGLARIVENSISLDPGIEVQGLTVTEEDGIISLYGSVDAAWMRREAGSIAENTIGVRAVDNNLVVVPPESRTDVEIRLDLISSLQTDTRVDASGIEVIVDDGEVLYRGSVASWDAWEAAYAIALQTDGVIAVESELSVES